MNRFSAFSPRLALGATAALAAISLSPGSAQAFVVNVGGLQYDVTTFTGSYNGNTSNFATAANGGVMPWWGSSASAQEFATAVGTSLSIVNLCLGAINCGPLFAFATDGTSIANYRFDQTYDSGVGGVVVSPLGSPFSTGSRTWAQATLYTAPAPTAAPGPLPLFGAAAAFGFSRKLRKRIKQAPGALGSALPQA